MKITYYGHSCMLAEHGGVRIILDPFLSGNPASTVKASELKVDAVILTHGHDDHSGDTALFGDMKLIGEFHSIDGAALPIGDNYTMGPEEAVRAAEWINPKLVIPVHYNTFPVIKQDGGEFARSCEAKGIACRVLAPGESVEL